MTHRDLNALKTFPLFDAVDDALLKDAFDSGQIGRVSLEKGERLYESSERKSLYCILEGQVEIEHFTAAGHLYVVEPFHAGTCIGANALFLDESKRPPMHVYATKKTTLISLDREAMLHLLSHDTGCLEKFLNLLSKRSLMLTQKVSQLSSKPLREKVIDYLRMLYEKERKNPVTLPTTKTKLAARFFVERPSLSRRLKALEDEGLIQVEGKIITLNDAFFDA